MLPSGALVLVLAVLAAACSSIMPQMASGGPDSGAPRNLCCHKSCCYASCRLNCTWEVPRTDPEVNYTLIFQYGDGDADENPIIFEAGNATFLHVNQNQVYALKNVTIWVESHSKTNRPPLRSEHQTLLVSKAVKLDAPPASSAELSRSEGKLTMKWHESHGCGSLPRTAEVRMRPGKTSNWSQVVCRSEAATGSFQVKCPMGENLAYKVQVRYRILHWSSYWSDWSSSVFVPVEILQSPSVNYTLESLGEDGLRNVMLEWERPRPEQGDVDYTLTLILLPCRECPGDVEIFTDTVSRRTSYPVPLSGARYNASLKACNKVSCAPGHSFQVPAAQRAGLGNLNISLSGVKFSLEWESKAYLEGLCFEKHALGDPPLETLPCDEIDAGMTYTSSGTLAFNRCYRVAVHGFDPDTRGWSTLGLVHLFPRNDSLRSSIRLKVTQQTSHSAQIWWEPPHDLSSCPGVLKKYILCFKKKAETLITYSDVGTSETQYVLRDLLPETAYLVGVRASTDGTEEGCRPLNLFVTSPSDARQMTLALLSVAVLGGIMLAAVLFHFSKNRLKVVLCPVLPDPSNTEAVKICPKMETGSQSRLPQRFVEPLESAGSVEPFLVDPCPEEEEPAKDAKVGSLGPATAVEEVRCPAEDPDGSGSFLPCEYKRQCLLSPAEDSPQGKEVTGGLANVSYEVAGDGGGPLKQC